MKDAARAADDPTVQITRCWVHQRYIRQDMERSTYSGRGSRGERIPGAILRSVRSVLGREMCWVCQATKQFVGQHGIALQCSTLKGRGRRTKMPETTLFQMKNWRSRQGNSTLRPFYLYPVVRALLSWHKPISVDRMSNTRCRRQDSGPIL